MSNKYFSCKTDDLVADGSKGARAELKRRGRDASGEKIGSGASLVSPRRAPTSKKQAKSALPACRYAACAHAYEKLAANLAKLEKKKIRSNEDVEAILFMQRRLEGAGWVFPPEGGYILRPGGKRDTRFSLRDYDDDDSDLA